MRAQTAVLVGPSLQGNLALEYLGAAAEAAGHRARLVSYDSKAQAAACVRAILDLEPDLIGLSISFQCAVEDHLELARLLRLGGYRGHLTCGGMLASAASTLPASQVSTANGPGFSGSCGATEGRWRWRRRGRSSRIWTCCRLPCGASARSWWAAPRSR